MRGKRNDTRYSWKCRQTIPKACNNRIQEDTTFEPHAATTNLQHYWLASKLMITHEPSPISSLVLAVQSAQDNSYWCSPNWLTGISVAHCQASAHGILPPKEESLSSETELRLLLFWDPVGLDVFLQCGLITEI